MTILKNIENTYEKFFKNFEKFDSNSIVFRIRQFLSTIHKKFFENDENADAYDEKKFRVRMNICLRISFSEI